jgi:hypothetical protein
MRIAGCVNSMPERKSSPGRHKSSSWDVGIATSSEEREINPDDDLLLACLWSRGLSASMAAWDDPRISWSNYRLLIIRSTWNYQLQRDRYLKWAKSAGKLSSLWNRASTLEWNTHKKYLHDLEAKGVPIVPTLLLPAGTSPDLGALMEENEWSHVVVKPAVSAGARLTYAVDAKSLSSGQARLNESLQEEDMMVQPYIHSVETIGERCLIFIDGQFSHAVCKEPVLVTQTQRLIARSVRATDAQKALARKALAACPEPTIYARVDMVQDAARKWRIGEVEVTEPYLYLGNHPPSAEALASAIQQRL